MMWAPDPLVDDTEPDWAHPLHSTRLSPSKNVLEDWRRVQPVPAKRLKSHSTPFLRALL